MCATLAGQKGSLGCIPLCVTDLCHPSSYRVGTLETLWKVILQEKLTWVQMVLAYMESICVLTAAQPGLPPSTQQLGAHSQRKHLLETAGVCPASPPQTVLMNSVFRTHPNLESECNAFYTY